MSASSTPYGGVGITLGYRTGGSGAFTSLGQLVDDCEFSGFETTVIPIKPLNQTVVTKVPGRIDSGSFDGSLYLVNADAGVAEIFTLAAARTTASWMVQLSDSTSPTTGSTYVFSGFVSTVKPGNFTGEDAPTLGFSIAVSGVVTVTAGS